MILPFPLKALRLMSLCYKQNLIFQLRAVRLSIAGYTAPNMENVEPTTVGRSFATGKRTKTIRQSVVFIRLPSHSTYCS